MTTPVDTSAISAEANRVQSSPDSMIPEALAQKLDQVDLLIADLGQVSEFTQKAVGFTEEAATEIKWNRRARAATLVVVLAVISGLSRAVWLIMTDDRFIGLRDNPVAFSTALAALVGGGVLLVSGVSKSVFSTFHERNSGMPMPDHLKSVLDGIGGLFR